MKMDNERERATVTIEEAALILGIGRATAYEAARIGQLPVLKLGCKRLVVPKCALDALLSAVAKPSADR